MSTGSPMRYLTNLYGFVRRLSAESDVHAMLFGMNFMATSASYKLSAWWWLAANVVGAICGAYAWRRTKRAAKAKP